MSEKPNEIYVVSNEINMHTSDNVYVGTEKVEAQEMCDRHQSRDNPCFIEVWQDGVQQYATRKL